MRVQPALPLLSISSRTRTRTSSRTRKWHTLQALSLALVQTPYAISGASMASFADPGTQTAVAIMVVVMAAACHPEAQNVVQEELDNVIGRDKGTHLLRAEAVYQLTAFT